MEKASFYIVKPTESKIFMEVMFNPSSYNVDSTASYSPFAGVAERRDILQFSKLGARTLSMDLYFDSINGANIKGMSNAIASFTSMSPQLMEMLGKNKDDIQASVDKLHELIELTNNSLEPPPIVEFRWGSFVFRGVMTNVKENYTMFYSDGRPSRATVSVTMQEYLYNVMAMAPNATDVAAAAAKNTVQSSQTESFTVAATQTVKAIL